MADELKAANRLDARVVAGGAKFGENRAAMVALLAALRGEEDGMRLGVGLRRRRLSGLRGG